MINFDKNGNLVWSDVVENDIQELMRAKWSHNPDMCGWGADKVREEYENAIREGREPGYTLPDECDFDFDEGSE